MARGRKQTPEQIVNVLRQIEVAMANGKTAQRHARRPELWASREFGRI